MTYIALRAVDLELPEPKVTIDGLGYEHVEAAEPDFQDPHLGPCFSLWRGVAEDGSVEPLHPTSATQLSEAGVPIEGLDDDFDAVVAPIQGLQRTARLANVDAYFEPLNIAMRRRREDAAERARALVPERPMPATLTRKQLAEVLQVSERQVDIMTRDGRLPTPIKLGDGRNAAIRWNAEAIAAFLGRVA